MYETPPVPPVAPDTHRPRWSVVLPAHNAGHYLGLALTAVLEQWPAESAENVEIIVVDDGSTDGTADLVRRVGGDRVRYERNETPLGAVPNFNHCLSLTSGEFVHLLHADDGVLEGFYPAMDEALSDVTVVAAVCRTQYIDENGQPGPVTRPLRDGSGAWPDALAEMAVSNRVRPAAIVVRRQAYEAIGGFRTDLPHAADWEMWTRLCAHGRIEYVDRVLATYRRHSAQDTAGRVLTGDNIRERVIAIDLVGQHLPADQRAAVRRKALLYSSVFAGRLAIGCLRSRQGRAAGHQVRQAARCLALAARPAARTH